MKVRYNVKLSKPELLNFLAKVKYSNIKTFERILNGSYCPHCKQFTEGEMCLRCGRDNPSKKNFIEDKEVDGLSPLIIKTKIDQRVVELFDLIDKYYAGKYVKGHFYYEVLND